jgi:general secretion pathway protein E/type IV pilus assembly protein PilB
MSPTSLANQSRQAAEAASSKISALVTSTLVGTAATEAEVRTAPGESSSGSANGIASDRDATLRDVATANRMYYVDLAHTEVDPVALACMAPREVARRQALPYAFSGRRLLVAVGEPCDQETLEELRVVSGHPLRVALTRSDELRGRIKELVGLGGGTLDEMSSRAAADVGGEENDDELANEASVMRLVNELLSDAFSRRASDVHLEPTQDGIVVRYRVDGLLQPEPAPPEIHRFRHAIVSRVKIMAKLNIAERRMPQDGRIRLKLEDGERDIRVSIIPMLHGEGVVMRLLDPRRSVASLSKLHFPSTMEPTFRSLIRAPHGLILVTGPTGSGKTTTLYSALAELRGPKTKIVTIEDPVEYELDGVNQIQVQPKVGLTFAAGLRSVLRHDPDIILVGEIRDAETARSAIQAAMTGHLVFSTLHTNDAPGAYSRIVDMGIEPYLAAGGILGVLAQRLVRRLCPHCKVPSALQDSELPADFPRPWTGQLWEALGCRECRHSGYSGRIAIFELMRSDAAVREACLREDGIRPLYRAAEQGGYKTLRHDGWQKVLAGLTSVDEVVRVTGMGEGPTSEPTSELMAVEGGEQ